MSGRFRGALALLCAGLLMAVAACEVTSPQRFIRAPIIKGIAPESQEFDVLVGDTVSFSISAVDPEAERLDFRFALADSLVSSGPKWVYIVEDTGDVEVCGRVFNRQSESVVRWRLHRELPENKPPQIVEVQPPDPNPRTFVGSSVEFTVTAVDPEGQPLTYIFTVDDSLVSGSNRYTYEALRVGQFRVKSIVTDGDRFASHEWSLAVFAEPDSIYPAAVELISLETGVETGELVVEWVDVGDDSMQGVPTHYVLRTSPQPIVDEVSWDQASDRPGEPPPAAPGSIQQMVIGSLNPANLVYAAVRAVDDFGNMSPLANTLGAVVKGNDVSGTVRDALTGEPLAGILLELINSTETTGVDGRFTFTQLPDGTGPFRLLDEDNPGDYGAYFDVVTGDYEITDEDDLEFWMIPNVTLDTTNYASFLDFVVAMTSSGGTFGHLIRNWNEPIDVYVPPFVNNGLDYERVIKDALTDWQTLTGMSLFRFVDAIPSLGFYFSYNASIDRDFYQMVESDERFLPILGKITMRTRYDPSSEQLLRTIAAHEIGHALGMGHSTDPGHLMVGGVAAITSQPTADEIFLARVMYRLPRGQSTDWFLLD